MLTALTVSNNADESYAYTFDYNKPKVVDGKVEYFAEAEKWGNGMSLKAGRSSSGGANFNASSGVGIGSDMADGRLTGGTQGSSTNSQSETESMLADIDGDGSPDYISVRGSTLYYRLNTKNGFAEEKKVSLEEIKLNAESSSSFSIGWNIYGGGGYKKTFVSGGGATYSYVNQKTTSRSTVELCDVDSDRKTDIILSGKNYYLKNTSENGKVSFRQELYDGKNSTVIENNIKKPTADEIKSYKEEYKIQTPFRQWKAEYDGNVTVVQNFSTADSFNKSNSVKAHVYKGKSENAESSLESTVSKNFFSQKTKGNLSVSKGENLYFITETEEPAGADVNYNVKIDYTDIYSYRPRLNAPVFFPQKEFLKKYDDTYSSISVIKKSDLSCPKDLESIYDNPKTVSIKENGTEKKYAVCTLKDNWIKKADEKVYSYLIKNGMFLPEAFTETQFEKILESFYSHSGEVISRGYFKKEDEDKIKEEVIYERFAEKFIHDLTDRIYVIRKNNDRELFDLIYNILDQKKILSESWNNYKLFNVDAVYDGNRIIYEQKSNVAEYNKVRKNNATGTQLQDGNLIVLADYNDKLLTASRKDGKVFLDGIEQPDFNAKFDLKEFEDKKENKLTVSLTYITSGEKIIYEFSGYMPKAWNITKDEMQSIANDYSMTGESLDDPYWNWNEKTEDEAYGFLKSFGMDTNQQGRFLELAYDKSVKEITEDGEVKESSVFTKKQNISADNFAEAENILSAVKFKRVTENEFPYYEKLNEEEFILKKEYDDDEADAEELIEKCNEHGLGKFCSVRVLIRYDENGLYNLDGNGEFLTKRIIENSISVADKNYSPGQISWDSASAWNGRENEEEKVLYKYGTDENESFIQLERREKLYPGNSNWFFGIWINGKKPFSGQYMEELLSAKYGEQINYDANKLSKMTEKEAEGKKGNNKEIPFYLPVCNTDIEGSQIYPVKKEYGTGKEDVENTLVGQISMSNQKEEYEDGCCKMVIHYYFPFIQFDFIHASRMGGDIFYNIEGIKESLTDSTNFVFPDVRMSRNEGEDKTFGGNAEVNAFNKLEKGFCLKLSGIYKKIKESSINVELGGNKSTNITTGKLTQTVMDLNGDSIPDIIQETKSGIKVYPGMKSEDGIGYGSNYSVSGININSTSSDTKTKGASISPNGSITTNLSKIGKVEGITVSSSVSGGAGYTYSDGNSFVDTGFIDINGDGLPDYFTGTSVLLNKGKEFSSTNLVTVSEGCMNKSSLNSVAVNLNIGKSSTRGESIKSGISAGTGLSYSVSSNTSKIMYIDINGDGLADKLIQNDGSIEVMYNTGSSFKKSDDILLPSWKLSDDEKSSLKTEKDISFDLGVFTDLPLVGKLVKELSDEFNIYNPYGSDDIDNMEFSSTISLSMSGSGGVNFNISIPVTFTKMNVTCSGGNGFTGSSSINVVNVSMTDLDGDGLVDHVLRIPGDCTYWKRNISGLYEKLSKINFPQGGNVEIDYAEQFGTIYNPNFKYVLSRVTVNDGTDKKDVLPELKHGAHAVTTTYKYSDGCYDREKKDFYGYGTVRTTFADGNCQTDIYYNREYYSKGCLKSSSLKTADGTLLSESSTTLENAPYALPVQEESKIYEKTSGTENYIYSATNYSYDLLYGNCIKIMQNFGDSENLTGEITYKNIDTESKYIIGLPTKILVYGKNGKNSPTRLRTGDYNEAGQLIELNQYWANNENSSSVNKLTYDEYGNIKTVSDSRGATLSYKYDDVEHMFVKEITQKGKDTESYTSFIDYDVPTQTKTSETDCNGNTLKYEYDHWQRIVEIRTDYDSSEKSKTPAVSYEYNTGERNIDGKMDFWYTVTSNKVTFDSEDSDIIQTVIQVDGLGRAVRTAKTGFVNGVNGWNVSGAVEYDEKGRTVKSGMTEFINGDFNDLLNSEPEMTDLFTLYEYDEKDRQVKVTLPDGSVEKNFFYIEDNKLISETKDMLENVSVQESDCRGNIIRVARLDKDGNQLTQVTYQYNEMGEMLKAFDAKDHPITVEYDMLGRRTALESLDSGRQEFFYDECSNLVRENNSVLKENNKQIVYEYDGLNRLVRIDYPDTEDTLYTYGSSSDKAVKAAEKILKVQDASGTIEYEYGSLGEVTKEARTLSTHLNADNSTETAVMEYRSDYLGRMQWIIYPDGEKITYGYDDGGQVISVTGEHYGHKFEYVTNILYDQYGQRTRIDYGNETFTEYTYDPARRWLDSIKTENKWGQNYQNISYKFDTVGNVLSYENNCLDSVSGNYKTKQSYSYDNLYQLVKAEGETTYNPYHSSVPEFVSKYSQLFEFDKDGLGKMLSKVSTEAVTPHKNIGDNLNYSFNYVYDENYAHRLINAGDRYYKYDSNGNIICEQDGSFESNGDDTAYHKISREAEGVYSTDYGWGLFKDEDADDMHRKTRYRRTYSWNERNQLVSSVDENYNTAYVYGQDGQRTNKYTANSETLYFNKMWTLHTDSGNNIYGGQTAKNIYLGETRIVTKLNSGKNPKYQEEYYKQYFYHSDHLGSASLISDYKGDEYQRIEYTPYGEIWVEKTDPNANLNFLPYKFTAKEMDEETGLYYYGARYLDSKYSVWISTDPALGEYIPAAPINDEARKHNQNLPGMGGIFNHINCNLYAYAANNPLRYIDPDGRSPNLLYAGTVEDFITYMYTIKTGIASTRGKSASAAMLRMGEITVSNFKPMPACTGPFNKAKGRYIYTRKGGWIDMSHFMFYAGRAYTYKQSKIQAQQTMKKWYFILYSFDAKVLNIYYALIDPVEAAIAEGYLQEKMDSVVSPHSAYSYEDLPTDKFGAEFGANYFDPNSPLDLATQIKNYLINELGATEPSNAPNYNSLPLNEPKNPPAKNKTCIPMYIN
ncbi:MAG: hypothetical protein K6B17_04870 [Treponema sp.]|nr:hypothetical protein [Treponema sp.]